MIGRNSVPSSNYVYQCNGPPPQKCQMFGACVGFKKCLGFIRVLVHATNNPVLACSCCLSAYASNQQSRSGLQQ